MTINTSSIIQVFKNKYLFKLILKQTKQCTSYNRLFNKYTSRGYNSNNVPSLDWIIENGYWTLLESKLKDQDFMLVKSLDSTLLLALKSIKSVKLLEKVVPYILNYHHDSNNNKKLIDLLLDHCKKEGPKKYKYLLNKIIQLEFNQHNLNNNSNHINVSPMRLKEYFQNTFQNDQLFHLLLYGVDNKLLKAIDPRPLPPVSEAVINSNTLALKSITKYLSMACQFTPSFVYKQKDTILLNLKTIIENWYPDKHHSTTFKEIKKDLKSYSNIINEKLILYIHFIRLLAMVGEIWNDYIKWNDIEKLMGNIIKQLPSINNQQQQNVQHNNSLQQLLKWVLTFCGFNQIVRYGKLTHVQFLWQQVMNSNYDIKKHKVGHYTSPIKSVNNHFSNNLYTESLEVLEFLVENQLPIHFDTLRATIEKKDWTTSIYLLEKAKIKFTTDNMVTLTLPLVLASNNSKLIQSFINSHPLLVIQDIKFKINYKQQQNENRNNNSNNRDRVQFIKQGHLDMTRLLIILDWAILKQVHELIYYLTLECLDKETKISLDNLLDRGYFEIIQKLIDQGYNVCVRGECSWAIVGAMGSQEWLERLVKLSGDCHYFNQLLEVSIMHSNLDFFQYVVDKYFYGQKLLSKPSRTNIFLNESGGTSSNSLNWSILGQAIDHNNPKSLQYLLDNFNCKSLNYIVELVEEAIKVDSISCLELLLNRFHNPNNNSNNNNLPSSSSSSSSTANSGKELISIPKSTISMVKSPKVLSILIESKLLQVDPSLFTLNNDIKQLYKYYCK